MAEWPRRSGFLKSNDLSFPGAFFNTTVEGHRLELIDERRGSRSRGQYLDDLLQGREPQPEAAPSAANS